MFHDYLESLFWQETKKETNTLKSRLVTHRQYHISLTLHIHHIGRQQGVQHSSVYTS